MGVHMIYLFSRKAGLCVFNLYWFHTIISLVGWCTFSIILVVGLNGRWLCGLPSDLVVYLKPRRYCVLILYKRTIINPFVPNAPFLYPLKTSENLKVFWRFQEVEKGALRMVNAKILSVFTCSKSTTEKLQCMEPVQTYGKDTRTMLLSSLHVEGNCLFEMKGVFFFRFYFRGILLL